MSADEKKKEQQAVMVVQDAGEFANLMDTARFQHLWRVAQVFAASKLVPEHFQGDPESCFVATHMALRLGIDPLMFLQKSYVVKGRPGIESTVLIALINRSGLFTAPLQFRFEGKPDTDGYTCIAFAVHKASGELYELPISWRVVKSEGWLSKTGSKWMTMPEQMFKYRTAAWFSRAYCPEVTMGLHSIDELEDSGPIDVTPQVITKTIGRIEALKKQISQDKAPQPEAPADKEPPPPIEEPQDDGGLPLQDPARPHTEQQWKKLHHDAPLKLANGVEELHATICMDFKHDSAKEITFDEASKLIDLLTVLPDKEKTV